MSGCSLGMFFEDLFVSWIDARQKTGCAAEETVSQILNWMEHDEYGFCCGIQKRVTQVLNKEGFALFKGYFERQLESAFTPFRNEPPKFIHDYPRGVSASVRTLKDICVAQKDVRSYLALCEKIAPSPRDCENIANLYKSKRRFTDALAWVERGLDLEPQRQWGNQSSCSLYHIREDLLGKVGRKQDAFESVWAEFQDYPSLFRYTDLMKYVSGKDTPNWHDKALATAKTASLSAFIEICTQTKEWDVLGAHIEAIPRTEIDDLSHFVTEDAAKGLANRHAAAACKIYCALGMRILKGGKSKYYRQALASFRKAKWLSAKARRDNVWQDVVSEIRQDHPRKYGFITELEKVVAGMPCESSETLEERAKKRWKRLTSR